MKVLLGTQLRVKKKKTSIKVGKVGVAGLKRKIINKKRLRKAARSNGVQFVNAADSIAKEINLKPNPCFKKTVPTRVKNKIRKKEYHI